MSHFSSFCKAGGLKARVVALGSSMPSTALQRKALGVVCLAAGATVMVLGLATPGAQVPALGFGTALAGAGAKLTFGGETEAVTLNEQDKAQAAVTGQALRKATRGLEHRP